MKRPTLPTIEPAQDGRIIRYPDGRVIRQTNRLVIETTEQPSLSITIEDGPKA